MSRRRVDDADDGVVQRDVRQHVNEPAFAQIRVGEEGGRLREMLGEVAVIHEEEIARAVERLLALLVPGVTLLLGALVGGIVLATLDAILGANAAALGPR